MMPHIPGLGLILIQISLFLALLDITTVAVEITWEPFRSVDLTQLEPHGWTEVLLNHYHLARMPKDKGYLVGMYHIPANSLYSVDLYNNDTSAIVTDLDKLQIMRYPAGSVSWELTTNEKDVERNTPYLVSGGKDTGGEEDVYYCRFVIYGRLLVGSYRLSNPERCVQTWSTGKVYGSNVYEALVLSDYGDALGVTLNKS